jgi:tRNA pseudouridine55 synthase
VGFGSETDTDDSTGTVIRSAPLPVEADVRSALKSLTGTISQIPPAYSAKSVDGTRAYDAARRGEPLELDPVEVQVHAWEVGEIKPDSLSATITCSGGTYIRALARDLGRLTSSAAHLTALRRARIGPFDVRDAATLDSLATSPAKPKVLRVVADA